jgi:hypothetical protein
MVTSHCWISSWKTQTSTSDTPSKNYQYWLFLLKEKAICEIELRSVQMELPGGEFDADELLFQVSHLMDSND